MNNGNIDALVYLAGVYIIAFVNPKDAFEVTQNFFNLIYANENRKLWTLYISNASIRTDPPQVQNRPPGPRRWARPDEPRRTMIGDGKIRTRSEIV